ncbi:MAG: type II secretion system major pseudopilin GspG [Burkholderiales bacterium]
MRIDRKQSGMTMMELLAVLVIIGVVMGVVGGKFFGQAEEAKRKAAKIEINQIGQSLDLFKLEVGRYPTTSEGLQALIAAPAGVTNRNGPYRKNGTLPMDPWKNEYKYTAPGQHGAYDIVSMGPDGKEGGDGPDRDITSWDEQ